MQTNSIFMNVFYNFVSAQTTWLTSHINPVEHLTQDSSAHDVLFYVLNIGQIFLVWFFWIWLFLWILNLVADYIVVLTTHRLKNGEKRVTLKNLRDWREDKAYDLSQLFGDGFGNCPFAQSYTPVIAIALLIICSPVFMIGWLIVQLITLPARYIKNHYPKFVEKLDNWFMKLYYKKEHFFYKHKDFRLG
jgi:hypothetical protein